MPLTLNVGIAIVTVAWRLRRVGRIEAALFTRQSNSFSCF